MSTTEKKWTCFKDEISWILSEGRATGSLPTAKLRKIAGLRVDVVQVYANAKCHLKGIFNALKAFRADRDSEGWRIDSSQDSVELLEFSIEATKTLLLMLRETILSSPHTIRNYYSTPRLSRHFLQESNL